ncbi:MAG TPA: DUF58 domain-containing protein [Alphaproteobacteria bacterium]|nr:DUF58 domain-containing protein [Alphaproteobacteria bacterium]
MREAFLNSERPSSPGSGPGGPQAIRRKAEEIAAALPALLVEANKVAATVAQGVHGRRRVGRGEAFWQFRRYSPGDPIQGIDWRRSAKSDALYIREREWEAAESVWLWRDDSASMRYRSSRDLPEKQERAEILLLAIAALLVRGGERVALLGKEGAPQGGQAGLNRLAETLLLYPAESGTEGNLPPQAPLPRFARLVMIGDFLSPLPRIAASVRAYSAAGATCHLLQVLDPAEETLPFTGRVRFEGLEGEAPFLVSRVENLREAYLARLAARTESLKDLALKTGGTFSVHRTDHPPQTALLALYEALAASPAGYMRD